MAVTEAANPLTGDVTLVFSADASTTLTVTAANTAATTEESVIEEDDSIEITFAGGTISKGDTFTVAGQTYTAEADDTINDVANGLAALLEDEGITNLVVEVTEADDPTTDAATLTLTATDGDAEISITDLGSQNAAVAAGGLGAIAGLSVETAADATTALTTIEALLDTSISAATAFGSAQTQIEGQGEFVQTLIDSMTSGIGAMVDADIEAASAKLQALQVQQQLGVQALSIANSNPQTLLSLFR